MSKDKKLSKPAPEGVSEEKYDSCVDQVKQEGDAKNAYAVCASSLKKSQKETLIVALEKTGHRESALLLKNWDELDDTAQILAKNLEKQAMGRNTMSNTGAASGINMAKDDMAHPPGSAKDAAHDAVEEPRQTVYEEIKKLSDDQARQMLAHLRNMKKLGKDAWKRSKENQKKGKD